MAARAYPLPLRAAPVSAGSSWTRTASEPLAGPRKQAKAQTPSWERLALGGGLVYAALQIGSLAYAMGVVVPTHAPIGAPAAEVAAALAGHADLIHTGTYLVTLPLPFFLLFLGGLFAVLRRAEGGSGALAASVLASGVTIAAIVPLGAVLSGLGGAVAAGGGDPVMAKELDSITPLAMALAGYPQAVLAGATALIALRGRLTPRWVALAGFAVAAVGLASTGTLAVAALFPLVALQMLLFPLWVLILAIALLRERGQTPLYRLRPRFSLN